MDLVEKLMVGTTGNHFHISMAKGTISGNGWAKGSNDSWCLTTTGGVIKAEQAFYLNASFTTVKNANGINLQLLP